jgi:hypothetical protein
MLSYGWARGRGAGGGGADVNPHGFFKNNFAIMASKTTATECCYFDRYVRALREEELPKSAGGFLVKAELRMTPDKGVGVFASQFIPANTRIYETGSASYTEGEASAYLDSLPGAEEKRDWLEHATGGKGKVCLDLSDTTRINHSDHPNMICEYVTELSMSLDSYGVAVRDIQEGEELREDYRTYSPTPGYTNLCRQYGVSQVYEMENYSK